MADFARVKSKDKKLIHKLTGYAHKRWDNKRLRKNCEKLKR